MGNKFVTAIIGDGISPEVINSTIKVLNSYVPEIEFEKKHAGIKVYEETGQLMEEGLIESVEKNKIALKGPIGTPIGKGFRSINVQLRKEFDLYANIRPLKSLAGQGRYDSVDAVIFRENTEDVYMGVEEKISDDEMHSIKIITRKGSERIARAAFEYAIKNKRKKVTAVTKANIMKLTDGLFLEVCENISKDYPGIEFEHVLVDNMCMQLVIDPSRYDIILTQNLYGDILSDLVAGQVGGLGLAGSANIGENAAIFEAVHGTAPDIAGKGLANPAALMFSASMMLSHMGYEEKADRLKKAVEELISDKNSCTKDLGGDKSTEEFTDLVIKKLQ